MFDQPAPLERTPRAAWRAARQRGLSNAEAASLVAYRAGLPLFDGERPLRRWTLRQVERCLFLRWLVSSGRLPS